MNRIQVAGKLRRLEVELLPPAPTPFHIIGALDPDAAPAEHSAMDRQLAALVRDGVPVWVVSPEPVSELAAVPGVRYVTERWQADLAALSLMPSAEGRRSAFEDLRARLFRSAAVIRPVPEAAMHDETLGDDEIDEGDRDGGARVLRPSAHSGRWNGRDF